MYSVISDYKLADTRITYGNTRDPYGHCASRQHRRWVKTPYDSLLILTGLPRIRCVIRCCERIYSFPVFADEGE